MEVQDYLAAQRKKLSRQSQRIRDFQVFDFNYIPAKPLMRQEAKGIIDAVLRFQQTSLAGHLLILGARGCGKSLLARYLMQLLAQEERLHFAYVNCRYHNTSYKILAHLLGIQARGYTLEELWQRFTVQFPGKVVFILDEIDMMSEKDKQKEILYRISRSRQNYMAVLLSNNPKFLHSLDQSTLSSLQPEISHFKNYHATEIEQILRHRAQVGLKFMPDQQIRQIAALTVKNTNSDVRVALKALYRWALEPDIAVEEHFETARRDILVEVIRDLNDKNLLILKAVQKSGDGYVKDIYHTYQNLSVHYGEEPFSYAYFYTNLSYLQSLGLILMISTKVGRTYTNRIQLTFDPQVLESLWPGRFG